MLKLKKTLLGSILILLVAVGVCFYFSQKKRPDREPVRIYSTTTPAPKKTYPEASHEEKHTHVESRAKPKGIITSKHSEEISHVDNIETPETAAEETKKTVLKWHTQIIPITPNG